MKLATLFPNAKIRKVIDTIVYNYSYSIILTTRLMNMIILEMDVDEGLDMKKLIRSVHTNVIDGKTFTICRRSYDPIDIFGDYHCSRLPFTSTIIDSCAEQIEIALKNHINTNLHRRVAQFFVHKLSELKMNKKCIKMLVKGIVINLSGTNCRNTRNFIEKLAKKMKIEIDEQKMQQIEQVYANFKTQYRDVLPLKVGHSFIQ